MEDLFGRGMLPLLLVAVCAALPAAVAAEGATRIKFASGPDDTGTVRRIIDSFNAAHKGKIEVEWQQMDRANDAHRAALVRSLSSRASDIDVMASDVIWTAELARNGWVEDLTVRFNEDYDRKAFLPATLRSASHRLRIWGIPWYTDAGMLFYRKDKLSESGFQAPPTTWDELSRMALEVMKRTGTRYGFVFQGAEYEGGTVNASEYIWSAGGELMTGRVTTTGMVVSRVAETDIVRVRTKEAAHGFDLARRLVVEKVAPAEVVNFKEQESLDAFVAGDAVFLRSWPYAMGILRGAGFTTAQIGVAPLPVASKALPRASCLGGWNLMIAASASRREQDAAWTLIRYLTDPAQQKTQARGARLLPVIAALYEDPALTSELPVMALGKEVFDASLRSRPKSPYYTEMSSHIAQVFNRVLKGEFGGSAAVEILDRELRAIAARN